MQTKTTASAAIHRRRGVVVLSDTDEDVDESEEMGSER